MYQGRLSHERLLHSDKSFAHKSVLSYKTDAVHIVTTLV